MNFDSPLNRASQLFSTPKPEAGTQPPESQGPQSQGATRALQRSDSTVNFHDGRKLMRELMAMPMPPPLRAPGTTFVPPEPKATAPKATPKEAAMRQPAGVMDSVTAGLQNTAMAFTAPLAAGGVLPVHLRPFGTLVAGEIFTYQLANPSGVAFDPPPTPGQSLIGAGLGFAPFAATFTAHAHMQGMPQLQGLSAEVGAAWKSFVATLPAQVRPHLENYPVQMVLGRGAAQLSAAAIGGVMRHVYLEHATQGEAALRPPGSQAHLPDPDVAATAFVTFALPAALATPAAQAMLKAAGISPVVSTGIVVGGLINAAVLTTAHHLTNQMAASEPPTGDTL